MERSTNVLFLSAVSLSYSSSSNCLVMFHVLIIANCNPSSLSPTATLSRLRGVRTVDAAAVPTPRFHVRYVQAVVAFLSQSSPFPSRRRRKRDRRRDKGGKKQAVPCQSTRDGTQATDRKWKKEEKRRGNVNGRERVKNRIWFHSSFGLVNASNVSVLPQLPPFFLVGGLSPAEHGRHMGPRMSVFPHDEGKRNSKAKTLSEREQRERQRTLVATPFRRGREKRVQRERETGAEREKH